MEKELTGIDRRKKILFILKNSPSPLSGGYLGQEAGVSRQVIVQDIALLRTEGYPILATPRGYLLHGATQAVRLFKLRHTNEQTEDELTTITDLGGCVLDVAVNHRVYGRMSAPLNIKNRRDVQNFMTDIREGKSIPLMNITSGYHFHHVSAETNEILDEIEAALRQKDYITELLDYEKDTRL